MKLFDTVLARLQVIMQQRGATLSSLNRNGGIAKSTLSQLFNHKQEKITLDLLYEILSTMGVSFKEFFDDPIFEDVTD